MLRNGCWGDVLDFLNDQKASLAALSPRHHPQHGHDPGHFRLDRCGFAAPSRQGALRHCVPTRQFSRRLSGAIRCSSQFMAAQSHTGLGWARERVVGSAATVSEVAAQWPAGLVIRRRCWGCPPPRVGRGVTPNATSHAMPAM